MKGICSVCRQHVMLVFDGGVEVVDAHEDADGHICTGSGEEPAGDYDDVEEE